MQAVAVREKPILFSTPMVKAILAGTKSQFRQVVSARNSTVLGYPGPQLWGRLRWDSDAPTRVFVDRGFPDADGAYRYRYLHVLALAAADDREPTTRFRVRCLHEPGDRLWVRETWRCNHIAGMRIEYRAGGACLEFEDWPKGTIPPYVMPTTPFQVRRTERQWDDERIPDAWRPSIHMPRWASRITLEIVAVRVERLASISDEDVAAEGFGCRGDFLAASYRIDGGRIPYGDNPWVWAIEFRRIEDARREGGTG